MGKKKILLVDDSETYRNMARLMLESRGYAVVTLSSPFAFGAALTRERPDLALIDAIMPALQGDQLVRLARQNNLWDCPIVLHSYRSIRELSSMVETSGATGFIPKTRDPDKLATAIEGFLNAAVKAADPVLKPISVLMDARSPVRRPSTAPESRRVPLESYRPPPESYRPPPESYRPPLESRSPPESRLPPVSESRPPVSESRPPEQEPRPPVSESRPPEPKPRPPVLETLRPPPPPETGGPDGS